MTQPAIARRAARLTLAAAALGAAACSRGEQPKVPLAEATQTQPASNPHDALPPAARAAIDSGNAEYRAGHYDGALVQYRLATQAAPNNAAPYFGVYMVAKKISNAALADSAMTQIRAHATGAGGQALTDSTMAKMHTDTATMRQHTTEKAKG